MDNVYKNVIYGLIDPNSKELRYIGYSSNLKERIRGHYKLSSLNKNTHKNNWIKSLLEKDQKAEVIIIAEYQLAKELPQAEIDTIIYYKFIGCDLVNGTDGGDGVSKGTPPWNKNKTGLQVAWNKGKHTTTEVKEKMSLAKKNKPGHTHTEFSKQKMRKPKSKQMREKLKGNINAKGVNKNKTWKLINGKRVWMDKIQ